MCRSEKCHGTGRNSFFCFNEPGWKYNRKETVSTRDDVDVVGHLIDDEDPSSTISCPVS